MSAFPFAHPAARAAGAHRRLALSTALLLSVSLLPLTAALAAEEQPPAKAASPSTTSPSATLPPVEVRGVAGTATSRPELAPEGPRNPFRTPRSSVGHTQTIKREEIESLRPRDVFELLSYATGVIATQSSRKGFSGLTIRGDSNFRWIVDGATLQPTMASRILKGIPVSIIEEVKIVRGASALTLGPLAGSASPGGAPVDGFIVIRTRKPAKDEAQLRAAVESFDTQSASVWGGMTFKDSEMSAYSAALASYGTTNGPDGTLDNGALYNSARENLGGMAKVGGTGFGFILDLMAYADTGSFEIPNANSHGTGQGSWYMDPSRSRIFAITGSKAWDSNHTTLFNVSRSESRQRFYTANTSAGPYSSVENDNFVTHINLRHNLDFDNTRLSAGADLLHWDAPKGQQYYESIHREEITKSWFIQAEQSLFDDQLHLDASLRHDKVDVVHGLDYYTGGAQPFGGTSSPLLTSDVSLPTAKFYSLGASWNFWEDWKVSARFGRGTQSSDGLNPRPGVVFDEDKQKKWEVGVEGSVNKYLKPSLNYFYKRVDNEKSLSGYTYVANNGSTQTCRTGTIPTTGATAPKSTSALTPCYSQSDRVRSGFEVSVTGALWPSGSYRGSFTHYTSLKNTASITPRNMAEASISQGLWDFTLTGAMKYVESYKSSGTDARAWLGDYMRFDVGLGYSLDVEGVNLQTTVYGRNLTDQHFETTNGIQDGGRVFGLEFVARY